MRKGFCVLAVLLVGGCRSYDGPGIMEGFRFERSRPPVVWVPQLLNERFQGHTFDLSPTLASGSCSTSLAAPPPAPCDVLLQEVLLRLGRLERSVRSLRPGNDDGKPMPGREK